MPNIVFLSQSSPQNDQNFAENNLRLFTESARLAGHTVYNIPIDWDDVHPDDALCYLRDQDALGIIAAYISDAGYYQALEQALLRKGIRLINDQASSDRAMEFEQFYPLIQDLTPKSVIVSSEDDIPRAIEQIGWPMFVKGGIKSDKEGGWDACVVHDEASLLSRYKYFSRRPITGRNKLIARQVAPLRRSGAVIGGFPESREYRTFLLNGKLLGMGYYWSNVDPFGELGHDEPNVRQLAEKAACRVNTPLMAVDLGQLETGEWIVIETGDLQFSGVTQMPHMLFWEKIGQILE